MISSCFSFDMGLGVDPFGVDVLVFTFDLGLVFVLVYTRIYFVLIRTTYKHEPLGLALYLVCLYVLILLEYLLIIYSRYSCLHLTKLRM